MKLCDDGDGGDGGESLTTAAKVIRIAPVAGIGIETTSSNQYPKIAVLTLPDHACFAVQVHAQN